MRDYQTTEKDMIFGIRAIIETIQSGKDIDKLLIQNDLGKSDLMKELIKIAKDHHVPISKVPIFKLDKITRKNHQGAICYISSIAFASLDHVITDAFSNAKVPLVIVLDRITDVRNFGAIARSAECMGIDAIVIPSKNTAQANSDAMKTSAGALNFIPICREKTSMDAVDYLKSCGFQIISCTEHTENSIYEVDFKQPTAIVMGSEENGICNDVLVRSDIKARIPMNGKISSFNVSVAAGIIMYEAIKQRSL